MGGRGGTGVAPRTPSSTSSLSGIGAGSCVLGCCTEHFAGCKQKPAESCVHCALVSMCM